MTPQDVMFERDSEVRSAALAQLSRLAHHHDEDVDWDVLEAVAELDSCGSEED